MRTSDTNTRGSIPMQAGAIAQGLLQYLSVVFPRLVWDSFGSWLRTIRPGIPPSEFVVGNVMRQTIPDFLVNCARTNSLAEFVTDPQDTDNYRPARACFCRWPTASKQSPTTMEKSSPLTPRSQPRWDRYPILPNHITHGNVASTNTPTAYSDSTSQKVPISLLCLIPRSKGSRTNSTLVPERYSATELLVRFSSTPKISPLHFAVEWATPLPAYFDHSAVIRSIAGVAEPRREPVSNSSSISLNRRWPSPLRSPDGMAIALTFSH